MLSWLHLIKMSSKCELSGWAMRGWRSRLTTRSGSRSARIAHTSLLHWADLSPEDDVQESVWVHHIHCCLGFFLIHLNPYLWKECSQVGQTDLEIPWNGATSPDFAPTIWLTCFCALYNVLLAFLMCKDDFRGWARLYYYIEQLQPFKHTQENLIRGRSSCMSSSLRQHDLPWEWAVQLTCEGCSKSGIGLSHHD